MSVCVCVYQYTYICGCTRMCLCARVSVACIYIFFRMYSVVFYSISDKFVRSKLGNRRFGLVSVMDPIPWRFEDRPMGEFVDQYWFMQ